MIPITCPCCGRTGKVPPDRFNAQLSCKRCHAHFYLNERGRLVLGTPPVARTAAASREVAPPVEIDLAETWRGIPRPAKLGVPCVVAALVGWTWFPNWSASPPYNERAATVGRALLGADRARAIALATPETAEAAGRWYDLARAPIAAKGPGRVAADSVSASLLQGDPADGGELSVMVVIATDTVGSAVHLTMIRSDGEWRFDAAKALAEAEQAAAPPVQIAKKR